MQRILRLSLPLACVMIGGCAAAPAKRDPRDPWERTNRAIFAFDETVTHKVAVPVAKGYEKVTPGFVRKGVSNFFANLNSTTTIANDLLQVRLKYFVKDSARFVLNTTLGIAGFLDPATRAGLEAHKTDFGQTLGRYGVGPGPYLVLPLAGPSDVRDALGIIPDRFTVVTNYVLPFGPSIAEYGVETVDAVDRNLGAIALLDQSYDHYAFARNAYLQNREFLIHGTKPTSTDDEENEKLLDELEKEDSQNNTPPTPGAPQQPRPQTQPQAAPPPRSQSQQSRSSATQAQSPPPRSAKPGVS